MCGTRLDENAGPKKSPKIAIWAPSHNFVGLYLHNQGTYQQSEKNFLSSNMFFRCPHNMVNIGPLTPEIGPVLWGTPADFNGFHVLAALLHGSQVLSVSQTLRRWTCSAGRPSRWALAHASSSIYLLSSSSFFSSPNLSGHRLDVYHTSTHGVALVRI